MRFDAQELVTAWQQTGAYPRIHEAVAMMAFSHLRSARALDLCCSTGLLAHHIATALTIDVLGVDSSREALDRGIAAGLLQDPIHMRIDRNTIPQLLGLIRSREITAVIGRRCLPELFGADLELGREFARGLREAGVTELVLEGRVATSQAVNPLASIDDEIALVSEAFGVVNLFRAAAFLRAL